MSEIENVNTTKYANGHRQCSGVAYIGDYDYGRRSSIANYYSGISICPQTPTTDTQTYKCSNNTATAILNTASVRTCANRDWHRRRRMYCKNNGAEMQQKFDYNRNFKTIITAGDDDWKSATKRITQPLTRALSNCISYTLPCWMVKLRSSHVIKLIFARRKYSNSNKNQNKNNNYKLTTRTKTTTSTTNAITALTILATGLTHLTEASLGQQLLPTPGHFRTNTVTTYFTNVSDQQIDNNNINNTNSIHFENHNNRGSIFPNQNTTEMNVSDVSDLMMMMIMNSSSMEQHYIATAFFNNSTSNMNMTGVELLNGNTSEYIFDRTDVRIIFITLYTIVFCCCFFGNLLVILVVTLSRRLRSITNFFLANLALADFCVGLFCVMQNLSIYLIDSWVFGEFLCRMYQFVHSLSYTASIFILVVICMERYFAIVHPITCKQILTATRLRMVILTVWITSAVYSTPKFVFSKTIKNVHTESGQEEEICVLDRKMFNSKLLDMINFVLLYVIPLLVMTILYSKIAIALWRSSRGLSHHFVQKENGMGMHNSMYQQQQQHHHHHNHNNRHAHHHCQNQNPHQHLCDHGEQQQKLNDEYGGGGAGGSEIATAGSEGMTLSNKHSANYDRRAGVKISESQVTVELERPVVSACRKASFRQHKCLNQLNPIGASNQRTTHMAHSSSNNVLRARRGVVRMLIIFVLTFALCNLPYHARKMWQYWSHSYRGDTNFNALFTPLTFLVTYFNSGINPLLYAFLSRNFRKGMRELLMCSWRTSKSKSSNNSVMHHKRATLQTHSLPTDTTHIGNEQL